MKQRSKYVGENARDDDTFGDLSAKKTVVLNF